MPAVDEFKKYREKLPKDQQKVIDNLYTRHTEDCVKLYRNEIQRDKIHSSIVSMCAYAFSESGPLVSTGYHFITIDPLYRFRGDRGNRIFDLIIYNKNSKRAILIECKSSIGDPRRDVLTPLADQIDNAVRHRADLEDEVGGEILDMEFVICGPSQDIEEVGRALTEEPLCLWTVDLFRFTLKLFNLTGSSNPEQTGRLVRLKQLHSEEAFRRRLFDRTESRAQIEGFNLAPTSHICRILSHVMEKVLRDVRSAPPGKEKRFWHHELVQILQEELPKVENDDIQRIVKNLHELAAEIEMITPEKSLQDERDLAFALKVSPRSLRTLEKEINQRYAELKCKDRAPTAAMDQHRKYLDENKGSLDYHFKKGLPT